MKKEIMCNILRSPSKYAPDKVSDAAFQAAELLDKGGTLSEDGTLTVFTVATEALAPPDPSQYVPKQTADTLFNYLCMLLELLDHHAWTNPQGVDFRTTPTFKNIKTVVLSNIVNNMKASGGLRPVVIEGDEQPEQAALRLYGQDSREFFCVCAERFLTQMLAEAGNGNVQHLELVPVNDAEKVIQGVDGDAPQG